MTQRELSNIPASVRVRLLNEAKASGDSFDQVLQYFAIERFLYRLSKSGWSERFIVKGAIMLRAWGTPLAGRLEISTSWARSTNHQRLSRGLYASASKSSIPMMGSCSTVTSKQSQSTRNVSTPESGWCFAATSMAPRSNCSSTSASTMRSSRTPPGSTTRRSWISTRHASSRTSQRRRSQRSTRPSWTEALRTAVFATTTTSGLFPDPGRFRALSCPPLLPRPSRTERHHWLPRFLQVSRGPSTRARRRGVGGCRS